MSADRFRLLGRGISAASLLLLGVLTAESCGFPDHTFIDDKDFYKNGTGDKTGSGAQASIDASMGAAAGQGGSLGGGGSSGNGGGGKSSGGTVNESGGFVGVGADGGIIHITREGGGNPFGTGGSAGGFGATDAGDGAVDAGPICAPGLSICNGTCTDLRADNNHCGTCTKVCAPTEVCTAGDCAAPCATGLTACTPAGSTLKTCVDTTLDENNCGGCNKPCPGGTVCDGSKCLVDCGTVTRCGTQCFDTTTDDQHCGNCTTNCKALGQVCSGSTCKTSCTTPYVACNNTCVLTSSDNQNCGGCGKPCGTNQGCVSGQCKTLVENCLNGIDDDRDSLVDCADPDCNAGYTCGSVPAGWQGPFALWSGAPNKAPSCPATFPAALFLAHDQLIAPAYACPDCGCSPSSDAKCNPLHFWYDITPSCTASSAWDISVAPDGQCVPEDLSLYSKNLNPLSSSIQSAQLTPPDRHNPSLPPYAQGSCTPNQVAPSFPDPSWGLDAEGCGPSASAAAGGGCTLGQCMPKPATPFGGKLCIFKSGVTSCPSSYPNSTSSPQYYETWTEGRKCTSCSCGGVACGGTVTAFTDVACNQNPTNIVIDGSCNTLPKDPTTTGNGMSRDDTLSIRWDNGGPICGSGSSSLIGGPTPDSPITVCCQ